MQHLQPNTTLQGGKYRIERMLGQGGFGITYLATQVSSDRQVAIKELFIGGSGQAINDRRGNLVVVTNSANQASFNQQKEKFKKEALRLASLNHPNLVKVHEFFEENGTAYFVMDYIEGEPLRSKLNREGVLSEQLVLKYLKQLLSALKVAHKRSIWHLDIKPENVMVDRYGHVYLIDFGASKHVEPNSTLTTSLALAYTPGFCPPELLDLSNESPEYYLQAIKEIGPWTDIYALGATMYNLLTDSIPPSKRRLEKEGRKAFMFPSSISSSTQDLIVWMMKPNKEDRPQNTTSIENYKCKSTSKSITGINSEETIIATRKNVGNRHNNKKTYQRGSSTTHEKNKKKSNALLPKIFFIALILGSSIGGYYYYQNSKKQKVIDNIINNMVYVEGGTFKMGHEDNDRKPTDCYLTYSPVHNVTLSPFYIGKFEVTQEEWEVVMGYNPSLHIGSKYPVERVTWEEAKLFVEKLSIMSGKTFRLPTEAEWEYAAKGGNRSLKYSFSGSNYCDDVAWCKDNSNETHEVGQKTPNELGIYDMSGNVIEYCQDNSKEYSASSQENPVITDDDPDLEFTYVICRGGGIGSNINECRVFERDSRLKDAGIYQISNVGFRIACTKK